MSARAVLLVDLEPEHGHAFAARCAGARLRPIPIDGELPMLSAGAGVVLSVVAISGRDEAGFERVRAVLKLLRACPLVVLARDTGIDLAVRLIRLGVADVIEPSASPMEVAARAFNHIAGFDGDVDGRLDFVGQSPAMVRLRERIANANRVGSTVLIQGETGTGKGVVARLIHEGSKRRDKPFVHVDCGALAPNLIESELFGHERGAFTGAAGLRRGRFETAEQGTIFLDEIGELPLHLQAKLLRVLEDRVFERVGGSATLRLNARIIAATNRKLIEGVRSRTFRPDLYFRLNVLSIDVPSLRERTVDVPLIVHAGLQRLCELHAVSVPHVSDAVHERLMQHTWPGNVRELLNLLERLAIEQRSALQNPEELDEFLHPVSLDALAPGTSTPAPDDLEPEDLRDKERIAAALKESGGNLSRTARRLELPRSTLRHRIARYALGYLVPKD